MLGNADPRASVPGEIVPGHEFYDYEDKYLDGRAGLRIPADLPADATDAGPATWPSGPSARCGATAWPASTSSTRRTAAGLLLNELNTIPGFTPISMYPKLWEASGLPYDELIDELVRLALERHDRRSASTRSAHDAVRRGSSASNPLRRRTSARNVCSWPSAPSTST